MPQLFAYASIYEFFSQWILRDLGQYSNAPYPTIVTDEGIVILWSTVHPEKANQPISLMPDGMTTLRICISLNASSPMATTGIPSIEEGIVISISLPV